MSDFISWIQNGILLMPDMTTEFIIRVILEVAILWLVTYKFLTWVRTTRAWTLLRGITILIVITAIIYVLRLNTILYIIDKSLTVVVISMIVIFQPELRRALEKIGSQDIIKGWVPSFVDMKKSSKWIDNRKTFNEIADASFKMGAKCTGALMVIKRNQSLQEINDTGIKVDGIVTAALLINIFEKNTPLHDGALTIEGDRAAYATCYLPLSQNTSISKDLGTRHRAALGVSEETDTVTVVVSEETGAVTVAYDGKLTKMKSKEELVNYLMSMSGEGNSNGAKERK